MTRAEEVWKQNRAGLLGTIDRYGYAIAQGANLTFVRHRYFDNEHGREIVEVRCGDLLMERISP